MAQWVKVCTANPEDMVLNPGRVQPHSERRELTPASSPLSSSTHVRWDIYTHTYTQTHRHKCNVLDKKQIE